MVLSQNGWTVVDTGTSPDLTPLPWVTGRVRAGDVHVVLAYLCRRFNTDVEPIDRASSWGYANRAVRGATDYSNHASGTAVDFNAPDHPLGAVGTFTAAQRAAIGRILHDLEGVVRWGGNYAGRKDEMHFEVIGRPSDVARVASRILAGTITGGQVTPAPITKDEDMPLNATDLEQIANLIRREAGPAVLGTRRQRDGVAYGEDVAGALYGVRAEVTAVAEQSGVILADVRRADEVDRGQLTDIQTALTGATTASAADPAALAAAIVEALPAGVAAQVVDELIARLNPED